MANGYDEFGWPLSAIERVHQQQGVRPTEGEYGYAPASLRQPLETGAPGPFSIAEYSQAVGENVVFDLCSKRRR